MKTVIFSRWIKDKSFINERSSLCIGVFDGIHLGHKEIFRECVKSSNYPVIITFDKNPKMSIGKQKKVKSLNTREQRFDFFEKIGFKLQVIIDFSPEIRKLSADEFISILYTKLNFKKLIVGEDFRLGSNKSQAGPIDLEKIMNRYQKDSKVVIAKPVLSASGEIISSSILRELIIKGSLDVVQSLLGNSYQLDLGLTPSQSFGGELLIKKDDLQQLVPKEGVYEGYWDEDNLETTIYINSEYLKISPISESFKKNRFLRITQRKG